MQKLLAPSPDESKPVSMAERIGPSPPPKPVQTSAFTTAFGCPREFLNNRFLYLVISPRARGLSIGVKMNPDKHCNFDCPYCEVNRSLPAGEQSLDVDVMAAELQATLALASDGRLRELPGISTRERYRRSRPYFSTARPFVNDARRTTTWATN